MISPVESEDPSSTTISSRLRSVCFKTDSMLSGNKAARFKVGKTTEMSGDSREAVRSICAEPSNTRLTLPSIEELDLQRNPFGGSNRPGQRNSPVSSLINHLGSMTFNPLTRSND